MPNMNITYKTMPQCEHNKIIQLHIYTVEIQKSNKEQQKNEEGKHYSRLSPLENRS